MTDDTKRIFLGMEVHAPWPVPFFETVPQDRVIEEHVRHLTLAFLGECSTEEIEHLQKEFPKPLFSIGFTAQCKEVLFLPPRHPRVVALALTWLDNAHTFVTYQQTLSRWLRENGFKSEEREFLPHATVCRTPFTHKAWQKFPLPLPCIVTNLHLFESLGSSHYNSLWTHTLLAPFEEIPHTADVAFIIRGENIKQFYIHAQVALAFHFPEMLTFFSDHTDANDLTSLIIDLNKIISTVDSEIGSPFKAISFHGALNEVKNHLTWEMIVDV